MNVTEPFLPPIEDFIESLKEIWDSKWLTNNGKFHQKFEARLAQHLGVPHVSLFSNGTLALVSALQALELSGEVITTPYSFVATAHSLLWNNLTPVFCDIDPDTYNIDPNAIEALITPNTTAILAVHCYGYPCAVEKIEELADKHDLKVIYDAAHAFDVRYKGKSVLNHGDLSILSFHATKTFNTIEGGAVVCKTPEMKAKIDRLKNFGFADEITVAETGLNAKMNELQAAYGLLQLDHVGDAIAKRGAVDEYYRNRLSGVDGIRILDPEGDFTRNHSYFPILVGQSRQARDYVHDALRKNGINARRYFFPLISDMSMYSELPSADSERLPFANSAANRVLCLPIHTNLDISDVNRVCSVVMKAVQELWDAGLLEKQQDDVDASDSHEALGTRRRDDENEDPFSLSVVIPVYKAEKYLERCLDSIFAGEGAPIEVIAVNDGSPDASGEILERYAARHPNLVVVTQENRGGAAAINRGLKLANNKYVMILDCDDWLDELYLSVLKDEAEISDAEVIVGKIVKTFSSRMEAAYDTAYINVDETVTIAERPSLFQDGMYLGKIFLRDLLEQEALLMDPTLLYADRPFVNVAMAQAKSVRLVNREIYYWRQREDAANLSATDQMHLSENLRDRVRSIRVIRDELKARGKNSLVSVVDTYNLKRLFWHFKQRSPSALKAFAEVCRPYIRQVNIAQNKNLTEYQRAVATILHDNSPKRFVFAFYKWSLGKKFKRYAPKKIAQRMKEKFTETGRQIDRAFKGGQLERITRSETPEPMLIVFESFFGKNYGGQPRYIYEKLLESGRAFRAVWVYQGQHKLEGIPGNVIQVHRGTKEYFNYLARAGYWVNNIRFTVTYKPPHTTYLQTWHGTPLKRLGLDIDVSGPELLARESFLMESANWDYLVAANQFSEDRFRSAFDFNGKYLTGGYPANDVFHQPEKLAALTERTREELGLPEDKKVILYAPTWRDDARAGQGWSFRFQLKLDLKRMKAELGEDHVLLLRMHHLIADKIDLRGVEDFAFDVSKHDDPTGLMAISDVMISDYSSIFFDYANLGRPIIFYMYDLEKYSSELRGFYFDPATELPGPIVRNFTGLMEELKKGDELLNEYSDRMASFQEKFTSLDDGFSTDRIVDEVFASLPLLVGGNGK